MATITLYAGKINQMPGLINEVKKSVVDYKSELSALRKKTLNEEKVIALYARGMSTRDISEQIEELYGFSLSPEMVSKITDRIAPEIKEWQQRPLEPIYTFVFMDEIH